MYVYSYELLMIHSNQKANVAFFILDYEYVKISYYYYYY